MLYEIETQCLRADECGNTAPLLGRKAIAARLPESSQMSVELFFARQKASSLIGALTSEPSSSYVTMEEEETVGSRERVPILSPFRSIATAKCLPAWCAAFSRWVLTQGLTVLRSSSRALSLCQGHCRRMPYVCCHDYS